MVGYENLLEILKGPSEYHPNKKDGYLKDINFRGIKFRGFRGRTILVISRTLYFADGDFFKFRVLLISRSAFRKKIAYINFRDRRLFRNFRIRARSLLGT